MRAVTHVSYGGQTAAIAGPSCFWLVDEIAALPPEDPVRRWVSWICAHAGDVLSGVEPGPWDPARAADYARAMLMPAAEFAPLMHLTDLELARRFRVPIDEVRTRALELSAQLQD